MPPRSFAEALSTVLPDSFSACPLEGIRILVVEDDPGCREALALALEVEGATVSTAASVAEALARLDESPPDVVLSDIEMPERDGFTLIRALREIDAATASHTPAIAVTGLASRATVEAILAAGFDQHAAKPVDLGALVGRVRDLASSYSAS